jgi:hypothetical protein
MMLSSTMREELMPTRYISYCSHRARCRQSCRRSPGSWRLPMMLSSTMREELMPTRYVSSCGYGGVGRCKGDHPPCSYQRIKILVLTSPSKVTSVCLNFSTEKLFFKIYFPMEHHFYVINFNRVFNKNSRKER